jgi:agmatinase
MVGDNSKQDFPFDDYSMFANVFSYMGFPLSRDFSDESVDTVIMGIPYDLATSGRAGTRSGPMGIRQASANL